MNSLDSFTKIATQYFAAVTKEPFHYGKKTYLPKPLRVSPGIFTRTMICHADCGGCCRPLTVDYLPAEERPPSEHIKHHEVIFNGKSFALFRDSQEGNDGVFCRYLGENARCGIHGKHPFSCDFELLRFSLTQIEGRRNQLTHRPFGRGWNMLKTDGTRGALCEWNDGYDRDHHDDVVRKLKRLKNWTDYFGLDTHMDESIFWVETGPHQEPLILGEKNEQG